MKLDMDKVREAMLAAGFPVTCNACGAPAVSFLYCMEEYRDNGQLKRRRRTPPCPKHQWCEQHTPPPDAPADCDRRLS